MEKGDYTNEFLQYENAFYLLYLTPEKMNSELLERFKCILNYVIKLVTKSLTVEIYFPSDF